MMGANDNDQQETQLFEVEEAKGESAIREEERLQAMLGKSPPKQNNFLNEQDTIEQLLDDEEEAKSQKQR